MQPQAERGRRWGRSPRLPHVAVREWTLGTLLLPHVAVRWVSKVRAWRANGSCQRCVLKYLERERVVAVL